MIEFKLDKIPTASERLYLWGYRLMEQKEKSGEVSEKWTDGAKMATLSSVKGLMFEADAFYPSVDVSLFLERIEELQKGLA